MCIGLKIKELMRKEKIDAPTLAKRMGKTKQAIYDMLDKDDLNTSILRQLSDIFNVPITYFFVEGNDDGVDSQAEVYSLQKEVASLKQEIQRLKELKLPKKDDRLYDLWMQFMKNQEQHQEIMKEMAAIYGCMER